MIFTYVTWRAAHVETLFLNNKMRQKSLSILSSSRSPFLFMLLPTPSIQQSRGLHFPEADQQRQTGFFHRCFIAQAQCLHYLFQSALPSVECTSYSVAAIPRTHDTCHSLSGP